MQTVEELDDSPNLELPSLQTGIDEQMNNFGVLTSEGETNSLPSDLLLKRSKPNPYSPHLRGLLSFQEQ